MSKTTVAPKKVHTGAVTEIYSIGMTHPDETPHRYVIVERDHFESRLLNIQFQQGRYNECGVNGVSVSDLLYVCLDRLEQLGMRSDAAKLEEAMEHMGMSVE